MKPGWIEIIMFLDDALAKARHLPKCWDYYPGRKGREALSPWASVLTASLCGFSSWRALGSSIRWGGVASFPKPLSLATLVGLCETQLLWAIVPSGNYTGLESDCNKGKENEIQKSLGFFFLIWKDSCFKIGLQIFLLYYTRGNLDLYLLLFFSVLSKRMLYVWHVHLFMRVFSGRFWLF